VNPTELIARDPARMFTAGEEVGTSLQELAIRRTTQPHEVLRERLVIQYDSPVERLTPPSAGAEDS
jgi:hypothetical protein